MSIEALPRGRSGRTAAEVAEDAARRAGDVIMSHFLEEVATRYKGTGGLGNVVTPVDLAAERAALAAITAEYPEHNLLSEEAGQVDRGSPYTWMLDPLDGTLNYAYGLSFFATSVALVHQGEPVVGAIYDPSRDEMFTARKGQGATLNGASISVSTKDSLAASLAIFDQGYVEEQRALAFDAAARLRPHVQGLRMMGSAALSLAYLACTRCDLYFHRYLYPWDIAAAILLVREAGGVVADWQGRPAAVGSRAIVGAAAPLLEAFLRAIQS